MIRILAFWMAPLTVAAALQLSHQHQTGAGIDPQRQAVAALAAELNRAIGR